MTIKYGLAITAICLSAISVLTAQEIRVNNKPARLAIRVAGEKSIRVTLTPLSFKEDFPATPALAARNYPAPVITMRQLTDTKKVKAGNLWVEVRKNPLTLIVTNNNGQPVQEISFSDDGKMKFRLEDEPVLGAGEGGPSSPVNSILPEPIEGWNSQKVEFDRRGRLLKMEPRPQGGAYGSRNPVAMLVGTAGWGLWILTPWGQIDLTAKDQGVFIPENPESGDAGGQMALKRKSDKGILPSDKAVPGLYDFFVFDAHDPAAFMKDVSVISGPAVMPPRWALGYMQSFRTLQDDDQMTAIVDTFRAKKLPVDAMIYLSSGFVAHGWSTPQPSFEFNPKVFKHSPQQVISGMHDRHVKVVLHIWPGEKSQMPTLHGSIPAKAGEKMDSLHISTYWQKHVPLVKAGVDGFWPDAGDQLNLFDRIKRHEMYYKGPLSTRPGIRPWSLHRNGYLGIAKWGGWVWSGDIVSSWKTLEAQIAVGINHSLSLSPFWGTDIGGFFPNTQLTGELYARWFQFGAFCACFRSHGKTWSTRLPWGWGLSTMGVLEGNKGNEPLASELNNPAIEPVCKTYDDLRYQLLPYNYTLAWEARNNGMPLMRAMWLQYPGDKQAAGTGNQYMWGQSLLIAPVFGKGAVSRQVYLPAGVWYDWWTNSKEEGGRTIQRKVDLATMPIYVPAGAVIPFDPVRQYTGETVKEPTTIRVYRGADGQFILYEDDGISQDYLKGKNVRTRFLWNDKENELTIEPVAGGSLPGNRRFTIQLFPEGASRQVDYAGKRMKLVFKNHLL